MFGNDSTIFQFRGPFGVPVEIGSSIILLAFIFIRPFGGTENILENAIFFALVVLVVFAIGFWDREVDESGEDKPKGDAKGLA